MLPLTIEQRPVSLLFQANNLFEHLSVWRNLQLGQGNAAHLAERLEQGQMPWKFGLICIKCLLNYPVGSASGGLAAHPVTPGTLGIAG
ncbi:MAG: hypothetical protein R3E89_11815 [Thiolinea sp.]